MIRVYRYTVLQNTQYNNNAYNTLLYNIMLVFTGNSIIVTKLTLSFQRKLPLKVPRVQKNGWWNFIQYAVHCRHLRSKLKCYFFKVVWAFFHSRLALNPANVMKHNFKKNFEESWNSLKYFKNTNVLAVHWRTILVKFLFDWDRSRWAVFLRKLSSRTLNQEVILW